MVLRFHLSSLHTPPLHHYPNPNPDPNPFTATTTTTTTHLRPLSAPLRSRTPALPPAPADSGIQFRRKLLFLENTLGLDSLNALSLNPHLRSHPISSLRSLAAALRLFGISSPKDAARVLSMHPDLLTSRDPSAALLPVLRFLVDVAGIPLPDDVRKAILRCPRLLVTSVEDQLLPTLYFLRRLGFVGNHRITCSTTLLLVSSVETTLIPKLEYLQSLGFSYKGVTKMVIRSPGLLTFSVENNFRPKVEFLVGEMGRDITELKSFPQYFSFSLENKIKPRHRLLAENGFSISLPEMLKVSDGQFNDLLVEMRLRSLDQRRQ